MQNAQKDACNLKKFQYNKGEKPNRTSTDIFWKEGELMHKKRFLRLISAVLALCMMAALLPTAAFAAGGGRHFRMRTKAKPSSIPSTRTAKPSRWRSRGSMPFRVMW